MSPRASRWSVLPAAAIFSGGLLLYVLTLTPSLVFGDPAEYTFVPHVWGILHPPGYALMTLLVKLWQTLVPIGSIAYRTNLLAAVVGAGAAVLVFGGVVAISRVTCHVSRVTTTVTREVPAHSAGGHPLPVTLAAAFAALSLLTAPDFWQHSLHANPHILTALLAAASLLLLLRWGGTGRDGWLYAFGFVAGLSVTHHPLLVFSFPAYAAYVIVSRPGILRDWRTLLRLTVFGLLGLLPWLYFPIRATIIPAPPLNQPYDMNTLEGFFNLTLARGLVVNLFAFGPGEQWHRLIVFWSLLRLQFALPVIALAIFGLGWLWRRAWRIGLLMTLFLTINLAFILNTVQDVMAYLLVPFTAIALLAGVGAYSVSRVTCHPSISLRTGVLRFTFYVLRFIFLAFLLVLPAARLLQELPRISLAREHTADAWVQAVFDKWSGQAQGALLLADWEHMTPLWYYRFVEGRTLDPSDLSPIYVAGTTPSPWVDHVRGGIEDGPVYLIEYRRDVIDAGFRLRAEGEFYRVLPPGETSKMPAIPSPLRDTAGPMEFLGYDLDSGPIHPGSTVRLALYFRAPDTLADIIQPVATLGPWTFAYTTDSYFLTPYWQEGEIIGERWDFTLPWDCAPGEYPLSLSLTNLTTGEMLTWEDGSTALPLGTLQVESGAPPTGLRELSGLKANFGQREGIVRAWAKPENGRWQEAPWGEPISVKAGKNVEIRLHWRSLGLDETSQTVFVHLLDAGNTLWASRDYTPLGGAFPTLLWFPRWLPGQQVIDPYKLAVPGDAPPGEYYLEVGLYGLRSILRTPVYDGAGNMAGDRFVLGGLVVVP